ncbi:MAG: hypothetical protein ACON4G_04575 [Candidatus Puniceispirillaceae bacterium]
MHNPTADELNQMIEAIFVKADALLASHDLDPPGDQIGFTELLRLTFQADTQGQAIFASMDDELLSVLFQLYDERRKRKDSAENGQGIPS